MTQDFTFQTSTIASIALASAFALTACGPQNGDAVVTPAKGSYTSTLAAPAVQKAAPKALLVKAQPDAAQRPVASVNLGQVSSIEAITSHPAPSGVGAVAGGVLGAVLGHQVGGGNGRKVATVVGAVGGAVAGNQIEKSRSERITGYRVRVQLDNGESRSFNEPRLDGLRVGDRVRVEAGQLRRS